MQRKIFVFFIFLLALSACQTVMLVPTPTPGLPSATPTLDPTATATATPIPVIPTSFPVTPTETPTEIPLKPTLDFEIRTHPDGGLFVGDQVSFEVIPLSDMDLEDANLRIYPSAGADEPLEAHFAPFGIAGRNQATLYWSWDTTGLEAGAQSLTLAIQPLGYTWTHTVTLASAVEMPAPEPAASWATNESDCCVFYYVTETAAAREITATLALADQQAVHAVEILGIDFSEPLVVTLMPRVLGQGGFASSEMYISFLDRNYAGNNLDLVLHHEMVHVLDQRLGGDLRPSILTEGLAVYLTGGHYKPEAMIPRAAALLDPSERDDGLGLGWYIPLRTLSDDFYQSQHEIGYIQAGALVEYLVDTWGWEAYTNFYRDIHPIEEGTQSQTLDIAMQQHFSMTLDELETDFVAMLKRQEITPEIVVDVRLTVSFFEVMRRYQQALDPSAYFLTAWLPDGPVMREYEIVADLLRRPSGVENLALETMLVAADDAMEQGEVEAAAQNLEAITVVLEAIETGVEAPFAVHPLAQTYFEIAQLAWEAGYQVEQINVQGESAQVIASQGWPELTEFKFNLESGRWFLVSSQ
jgi:hypothetical protein